MTIYDLAKSLKLPTETVQELEGILNSILQEKAAELQSVHLAHAAEIDELTAAHYKEVDNLKIDFDMAATLRQETLVKHAAEIEAMKAAHAEGIAAAHANQLSDYEVLRADYTKVQNDFLAYRNAAEAAAKAAKAVIADKSIDDTATVAKIDEITTGVLKPVKEREQDAIKAEIAKLQAKLSG